MTFHLDLHVGDLTPGEFCMLASLRSSRSIPGGLPFSMGSSRLLSGVSGSWSICMSRMALGRLLRGLGGRGADGAK